MDGIDSVGTLKQERRNEQTTRHSGAFILLEASDRMVRSEGPPVPPNWHTAYTLRQAEKGRTCFGMLCYLGDSCCGGSHCLSA